MVITAAILRINTISRYSAAGLTVLSLLSLLYVLYCVTHQIIQVVSVYWSNIIESQFLKECSSSCHATNVFIESLVNILKKGKIREEIDKEKGRNE